MTPDEQARRLAEHLGAKKKGREWETDCPVHDPNGDGDSDDLIIQPGREWAEPWIWCRRGCEPAEIIKTLIEDWAVPAEWLKRTRNGATTKRKSTSPFRSASGAGDKKPLAESEVARFVACLAKRPEDLAYLREARGLTAEVVAQTQIGYNNKAHRFMIPVRDAGGQVVNFRRYKRDPAKGECKMLNYVSPQRVGYGSPTRLLNVHLIAGWAADEPVWYVGGEWDAYAAQSNGLHAVCGTNGEGALPRLEDAEHLFGRTVYIALDCDEHGRNDSKKVANALHGHGCTVRVIDLGLANKEDVNDWFAKHKKTAGDLKKLADDASEWEPTSTEASGSPTRPEIVVTNRQLRDMTKDAIAAIHASNDPPIVFQRHEKLVGRTGVGAVPLDIDGVRHLLSEVADWIKVLKDGGPFATGIPADVIKNVRSSRVWPFPVLDRVVFSPVFAEDGSLRDQPGYHPPSRSLYLPPEGLDVPPVPDNPTAKDANRALTMLSGLLADFTFKDAADKAHALALILQPFARELIRGNTPMFSIQAPKQGTGKTLLMNVALAPAVGDVRSFAEQKNDEYMHKVLTAEIGLGAAPVMAFDNLTRSINYASLSSALTKPIWQDRKLGVSETVSAPIFCTWVLTANNPSFSPDMARRVVRVRLDARLEDPSKRTGFALDLPDYALEHRGELIWAACTLIRAWVVAGKPKPVAATPELGSYRPWRRVLGGILTFHGVPGFLDNLEAAAADDQTPEQYVLEWLLDLVSAKAEFRDNAFTGADVMPYIEEEPEILNAIIPNTWGTLGRYLGKFLSAHKDQIVDGHTLMIDGRRGSGLRWVFVPNEEADRHG